MSTASSRASEISVSFGGKEQTLEQALDQCMREVQTYMNNLAMSLRLLANVEEQEMGDDIFKEAVRIELEVNELVDCIHDSTNQLSGIAEEIRGPTPPGCKKWYTAYMRDLKARKTAEALALKEKRATEKATHEAAKAALAAVQEEK